MQVIDAISGHKAGTRDSFWERYVARMRAQGVKSTVVRWSIIRAEHDLRAVSHQRFADHTTQDVTYYREKLLEDDDAMRTVQDR